MPRTSINNIISLEGVPKKEKLKGEREERRLHVTSPDDEGRSYSAARSPM